MTASDCYRFCLSNPHVDLVLTGPKNSMQLQENLRNVKCKYWILSYLYKFMDSIQIVVLYR
jgi:predicted aldo/keto reductase-like oxidoreductase